jgi:hypothetical protein
MLDTELNLKRITTLDTPMYFGAEGVEPQATFLSDEPIIVSDVEREQLIDLTVKVANFIRSTPISKINSESIGINPNYFEEALLIDGFGNSSIVYGGIDISRDSNGQFKVIEINPRVQAMGLQDFRQEAIGIPNEPNLLNHFVEWLHENDISNITLLGSTRNAFYRGYDRVTEFLNENGINTIFTDTEGLKKIVSLGYKPQLLFRNCSNEAVMNDREIVSIIDKNKLKIINPLHASFYGYRGFLNVLHDNLPEVLPGQIVLNFDTKESDLVNHPWLKLEAKGEEYVVNFNELRRWGKTSIMGILQNNFASVADNLKDKTGGDASKIRNVAHLIQNSDKDEIVWIAQENIEPESVHISLEGKAQSTRLLYRTYWLYKNNGSVAVSAECFGCTDDQFKKSKGKINAGTGFSVPIRNFRNK